MIAIGQQLPPEVARYIDGFVVRRRVQRLGRAAARAMLFTIVWTLAWCVVDRLFALDGLARATLLGINVAIVTIMLARPTLRMLRRADLNVAAAEIERREPRLSQRLRTITSRISGEHDYGSSRELLDALSQQVADEVRDRNPAALLSWRPVIRPVAGCALLLLAAWLLTFSSWLDLPALARRYFMPLGATPAVTTTRLIVTPGDADVTQGEPLRVQATILRLSAAGRSPALHVRALGGDENLQSWHVEPMTALPDGRFEAQIARVDRDLEYFLTAGDARTQMFRVTMLPRPAVKRFRIRYTYPPHTALAARELTNETGVIEAPAGTDIALAIETTEPLSYAVMTIGAESTRIGPATATRPTTTAQTTLTITDDRRYTLRMVSDRGVSGVFRGGTIRAIADRAPIVQFRDLGGSSSGGGSSGTAAAREVAAGDVVPIAYQAVDDYGLARLDLDVRVIRKSGAQANSSLPVALARGQRDQQGVVPLELRRYGVNVGDEIELRLQAEDRAGQFAPSAPARLLVTSAAAPQSSPPPSSTTVQPTTAPAPAPLQQPSSPPLDPPGYEAAIRAYFDALRSSIPTTQP